MLKSTFTLTCHLTWLLGSIKGRFAELGYVEEDVKQLRWHREVSVSKPMSDRGVPYSIPRFSRLILDSFSMATYRTASYP